VERAGGAKCKLQGISRGRAGRREREAAAWRAVKLAQELLALAKLHVLLHKVRRWWVSGVVGRLVGGSLGLPVVVGVCAGHEMCRWCCLRLVGA
jgi:hypothetical protein